MSIQTEAIQVAAAAAALVEDLHRATTSAGGGHSAGPIRRKWWEPIEMVLGLIRDERVRRGEKWGTEPRSPLEWLMVLTMEAGELAGEVRAAGPSADRARAALDALDRAAREAREWLEAEPGFPGQAPASKV